MKKLFLGLISILLVSGCAGLPFDLPFFDGGGPNVTELGPDIIVIQGISIIPNPPLRPEDQFSVYFEVKNQDDIEPISGVSYELYDTGLCVWQPGGYYTSKFGSWSEGFAPLETKLVEWVFKAPSLEDIAHLRTTCPIKFKVNYSYTAKSQIDVSVINENRLKNLQRAGEDVIYEPNLNVGRGPIKIYFDFGNTLPIKESSSLSVYLKVEDKGNGLLGQIENDSFSLETDSTNFIFSDFMPEYFTCTGNICKNNNSIPLINKETFEIRFVLDTPPEDMEKTYYITAKLNYTYDVIGEANVAIEPR